MLRRLDACDVQGADGDLVPDELLDGVQQARTAQQVEHLRVQVHGAVGRIIGVGDVDAQVVKELVARVRDEGRQPVERVSRLVLVSQLALGVQTLDQAVEHHAVLVDERLNVPLDIEHTPKDGVPLLSKLLSRPRLG